MIDLRFDRVSKRYRMEQAGRGPEFWALRHVSFEVGRGETLGVIGQNGAGKSTILKLLSRITAPTEGTITIHGRLAALIEVGSGFHPELTGKENVFLSGSILGMRRREIAEKLDRIVEFSGVGTFIDTPVKWYSSGMYVRLGFAIAAHLEADILLVDEVLAVGDAEFQAKCLRRIDELKRNGTTMIFISHDLTTVERVCDRALLLQRGEIVAAGVPADVTAEYHRRLAAGESGRTGSATPAASPGGIELTGLEFEGLPGGDIRTGAPLLTRLRYRAERPLEDLAFEVTVYSPDGRFVITQFTTADGGPRLDVPAGTGAMEFSCPALGLQPGSYYVGATVRRREASYNLHWWDGGSMLYVEPGVRLQGQFYMPHDWRLVTTPQTGARAGAAAGRGA